MEENDDIRWFCFPSDSKFLIQVNETSTDLESFLSLQFFYFVVCAFFLLSLFCILYSFFFIASNFENVWNETSYDIYQNPVSNNE